ncbi:flagellar basal body-associated FliL family protein [Cognatishimia sp. MH4019]|uniref:flagellar basal body-associated FliL family protein n=1 Tax=Cognatishimia sp. MH4019 TaxID=2854030 RepID=UPI001CD4F055|nr:flagellar basal body-associated FliL family protein [Cognatishimia sp. MH4019]
MGKILPILMLALGAGAGIFGGKLMMPEPEPIATEEVATPKEAEPEEPSDVEYVKLNNQFVIPVIAEGRVISLVVLALTVEVKLGEREAVYAREPRLRDAFLQVMFDHANIGGFDGAFTNSSSMDTLRHALTTVAVESLGPSVKDVLITDIVRQDS